MKYFQQFVEIWTLWMYLLQHKQTWSCFIHVFKSFTAVSDFPKLWKESHQRVSKQGHIQPEFSANFCYSPVFYLSETKPHSSSLEFNFFKKKMRVVQVYWPFNNKSFDYVGPILSFILLLQSLELVRLLLMHCKTLRNISHINMHARCISSFACQHS